VDAFVDEEDVGVRAFLAGDDGAHKPGGKTDIENVAQVPGLEIGDRGQRGRIVEFGHEELVGVHDTIRSRERARLVGRSAGAAAPAGTAARSPAGAIEQRIDEGIGVRRGGVQQALHRVLGSQGRGHARRAQACAAIEEERLDPRRARGELIAHQQPVVTAKEPDQEIVPDLNRQHVGEVEAAAEHHGIDGGGPAAGLEHHVSTVAGIEEVGAVAATTGEQIVTARACETRVHIDRCADVDDVVVRPALAGAGDDLGQVPGLATGEGKRLDHARPCRPDANILRIVRRSSVPAIPMTRSVGPTVRKVMSPGAIPASKRIVSMAPSSSSSTSKDNILAIAQPKDIGVRTAVALQQVVALVALQDVVATPAFKRVVPFAPEEVEPGFVEGRGGP
jgi:hypothetical protein